MRSRTARLLVTFALAVGLIAPVSPGALAAVDGAPGTTLDTFTQAELDNNWEADRYFPTDGVTSVTAFGRDDVARIGIDSTGTQPGTFQRTEGIKNLGYGFFGRSVQVDLYLDPDWADTAVRAGFWVVGSDGAGGRDEVYGIIEFVNNEPCPEVDCSNQGNITDHEGFRIWDSNIGWAEDLATAFTYGTWVTLGIELDPVAEEYIYTIDGVEVGTASAGTTYITQVFLNSYNYGLDSFPTLTSDSYAAHWHAGSESAIDWTTEVVSPDAMNDWGFAFDSGADGSGEMQWGPGATPAGGGSAFFELGDGSTGYIIGTQGHGMPGLAFMDVTALQYSTYRFAGDPAEAVALQFNVDYDLTDSTTSWQGRLVYEPYYTQTVLDDTWQTWDTLATGANWWSTGTPQVGDAAATKYCLISDPCTWDEVLSYYPDAGIHELPLAGVILKAGSGWPGFAGNADKLMIATGDTGTIFDFEPTHPEACDAIEYSPLDSTHVLYGDGEGTSVVDGYMLVDLTGASEGQVTFWDGTLVAGSRGVHIIGSDYDDVLCGTTGDDLIQGRQGGDRIFGFGSDTDFDDAVAFSGDRMIGNAGDDAIFNILSDGSGSPMAAFLGGSADSDELYAGDGADLVKGGPGADTLDAATYGLGVGAILKGNAAGDMITGGAGADQELIGGPGADTLVAGSGADQWLKGGALDDTITNLGDGDGQIAWGQWGHDTITGDPTGGFGFWAGGGPGNDTITGGPNADVLKGSAGDDVIKGMGGEDELYGGADDDTLWGGEGADLVNGFTGNDVLYGNEPDGLDADIGDGAADSLVAKSSGPVPGPATTSTFYGNCDAADSATDTGDGVSTAYSTTSNTNIDTVSSACGV